MTRGLSNSFSTRTAKNRECDNAIAAAASVNRDIDFATIDMLCLCPDATLQWKANRRWLCHLLRIEVEAAAEDDDEDA